MNLAFSFIYPFNTPCSGRDLVIKRTLGFSLLLVMMAMGLVSNTAFGATAKSATLWTTDINGAAKTQFNLGETVYIHWLADGTIDIIAKYQDGSQDQQWPNQGISGIIQYVPGKGAGIYYILGTGAAPITIACGTILVIPEVQLGTLMAVTAFIAGFGFKIRKAKL